MCIRDRPGIDPLALVDVDEVDPGGLHADPDLPRPRLRDVDGLDGEDLGSAVLGHAKGSGVGHGAEPTTSAWRLGVSDQAHKVDADMGTLFDELGLSGFGEPEPSVPARPHPHAPSLADVRPSATPARRQDDVDEAGPVSYTHLDVYKRQS